MADIAMVEVLEPGPLCLVEDLGRVGSAAIGVGRSGAADRAALRLGNRMLGNDESAAGIEVTVGPFQVRFRNRSWFTLTGSVGDALLDEDPVEPYTPVLARAGAALRVGPVLRGLRGYLAVRGGIATDPVLGSRAVDLLSGVGGEALRRGDMLPIGREPDTPFPASGGVPVVTPVVGDAVVRAYPGPRSNWFTTSALAQFYDEEWLVSPRSNRIGVGLEPARDGATPLQRAQHGELPSEAMLPGAVQVFPSGAPTVLFVDHPVTGGYPVIAVVADADLDVFAQLRPGQPLRFRRVTG